MPGVPKMRLIKPNSSVNCVNQEITIDIESFAEDISALPTPALPGSGSLGMISARCIQAPPIFN
jgi:hypothetical protein